MTRKILTVLSLALLWPASAQALDLNLGYDIVEGADGTHVVSVVLDGYPGANRRELATCALVFPINRAGNPYIADINCDGRFLSVAVTQCGVLSTDDGIEIAGFLLEPGQHVLNGLPLLVEARGFDPLACETKAEPSVIKL